MVDSDGIVTPTFITVCVGVGEREGGGACCRHPWSTQIHLVPGAVLILSGLPYWDSICWRGKTQGLQNKIKVTWRQAKWVASEGWLGLVCWLRDFISLLSLVVLLSPQKINKGSVNRINEWWLMNEFLVYTGILMFLEERKHTQFTIPAGLHISTAWILFPIA